MHEHDEIPPALIEALKALSDAEDHLPDTVFIIVPSDPRAQLIDAFQRGIEEGHRFHDVLGDQLGSPEAIIEALKADGRVEVTQVVELDPELAPYV